MMATPDKNLARGAHAATILAAVVAIVTLGWGFFVFQRSTELQKEVTAVGLFRDYIGEQARLAETMPLLQPFEAPCSAGAMAPSDFKIWKCSYGLFVGESILKLRGANDAWRGTVMNIISDHAGFIRDEGLPCKEYEAEFMTLVSEVVPDFKCTSQEPTGGPSVAP